MKALSCVDLFCGCGGMSLGAARAGFSVLAGADLDAKALSIHARNFPKTKHLHLDISTLSGPEVLAQVGRRQGQIDAMIGGPPCQGFSSIGRRQVADTRNDRLNDFFRLVSETKPRAFVVENVPGLLSPQYREVLDSALDLVRPHYTILPPHLLKATDAGAPTTRKRVVIVGFRKPMKVPSDFWGRRSSDTPVPPTVRAALSGLPLDTVSPKATNVILTVKLRKTKYSGHFFDRLSGKIPPGVGDVAAIEALRNLSHVTGFIGTDHSRDLEDRYGALLYGKMDSRTKSVRLDPDGFCPTLRAGTGPEKGSFQAVRPIHYLRPRVITPREAARLQGFPDWFQFDNTKWHSFRQIGNSVSPLVSEFIMTKVAEVLDAG